MSVAFRDVLDQPRVVAGSVDEFWQRLGAVRELEPVARAVRGGAAADRLGFAFVAGYSAALSRLGARHARVSFCVTEPGGAHPRALATTVTRQDGGLVLEGEKSFATLATFADELLVLAVSGGDETRKEFALVRVRPQASGVSLELLPTTPFAPEVPHARVRFAGVAIADDDVLPGDGWTEYAKPFRTVEDGFVHLSLLGYWIGVLRRYGLSSALLEQGLCLVAAGSALAAGDAKAPALHLALAGLLDQTRTWLSLCEAELPQIAADERERWLRDRPLMTVASKARQKRRGVARAQFGLK